MKNRQSLKSAVSIVMALAGASVASAVGFIVLHRGDILNATVYQPVATASTTSGAASVANTASQNSLVNAPLGAKNSIDDSSGSSNNPSQGTVGSSTATASSNSTESSSISDKGTLAKLGRGIARLQHRVRKMRLRPKCSRPTLEDQRDHRLHNQVIKLLLSQPTQ